MTTSTDPPPHTGITRQDVLSVLGALGAIITLAAAVMYYFGWRRSDAQAREMSIDVSLFGFSSQDYVLRSISSLYLPLLVIVGLGLAGVWFHLQLGRLLRSDRLDDAQTRSRLTSATRIAFLAGVTVAAACVVFSVLAGERWAPWPVRPAARVLTPREWVVPLGLVVSTLIAAYAAWVRGQLTGRRRDRSDAAWLSALPPALVASTVLLSGFWLLEEYAASVGRDYAFDIAAAVVCMPHAVVTSPTPLDIQAPNVNEAVVSAAGDPPRYRTTGLRLLARSGGKILLVHDGWTPETGTVIVLADSEELVWEFFRSAVYERYCTRL